MSKETVETAPVQGSRPVSRAGRTDAQQRLPGHERGPGNTDLSRRGTGLAENLQGRAGGAHEQTTIEHHLRSGGTHVDDRSVGPAEVAMAQVALARSAAVQPNRRRAGAVLARDRERALVGGQIRVVGANEARGLILA